MSRFYMLELYAPQGDLGVTVSLPAVNVSSGPGLFGNNRYSNTPTQVFTSHPNGVYDPAARNISFDIITNQFGEGGAEAFYVEVEGVSFDDIKQNNNYVNYGLRLYAGMLPGLPLADNQPPPALIAQGYVLEGIGNWVGTDMAVTFVCAFDLFSTGAPGNLVFRWQPGQTLQAALQNLFITAYPGYTTSFAISSNLVTNHTVTHMASSLHAFSAWLLQYTKGFLSPTYPGVSIYTSGTTVLATDGTAKPPAPTQLHFADLIGQPVWADASTMDITVQLRGDIQGGDYILLPKQEVNLPGLRTDLPSISNAFNNYNLAFHGTFLVKETRQIGDYRSTNGQDWATVIRCVATVQNANPN